MGKFLQLPKFLTRNASTILTFIGAGGVIATSVIAVKATPGALKLLERAKEEKGEDLTTLEKVKVAGPAYIPAVVTGASTIACIFGANVLNKRNQASLMSHRLPAPVLPSPRRQVRTWERGDWACGRLPWSA